MKTKLLQNWAAGATAAILGLAGGTAFVARAQDQPPPPPAVADTAVPDNAATLPPNVAPSSPLAQVIGLAQAGVDESVILTYVTNSSDLFSLTPDQIIYLKDIGVPDEIVTAMMQHDQVLLQQGYQPSSPPASAMAADQAAPPPPTGEVTVNYFYGALAPYGAWVDIAGYGLCWRPTVIVTDGGWQPYCDHGHWVWTDDGWYWISDYSWGWATFHYGRWFRNARYGWCWYPGTVWGPSWVTWRYGDGYCGWAPLPPHCVYREGVGLFYNGAAVTAGFSFGLGVSAFTFVPTQYFCDSHPWHYRVHPREATVIFNHTTILNNFNADRRDHRFINRGIDPDRITRVTHREIHPVTIRDTTGRVPRGEQLGHDGRTLMVNRPHFTGNGRMTGRESGAHISRPSPVVGAPQQPSHNNNGNNNVQPPRRYQPAPSSPTPERRPNAPVNIFGSPSRSGVPMPTGRPPSPGNRSTPVPPVQPQRPNYSAPDNRRYVPPRMEQNERQHQRINPAVPAGANHYTPPTRSPQRNYGAPATPSSPPVRRPEANHFSPPAPPAAPPQPEHHYSAPQNEAPAVESRPSHSEPSAPAAVNPSRGGSEHPGPSYRSQDSGRDRGHNGR